MLVSGGDYTGCDQNDIICWLQLPVRLQPPCRCHCSFIRGGVDARVVQRLRIPSPWSLPLLVRQVLEVIECTDVGFIVHCQCVVVCGLRLRRWDPNFNLSDSQSVVSSGQGEVVTREEGEGDKGLRARFIWIYVWTDLWWRSGGV